MSYRVIVDSCGELTLQMKESGIFKTASLSMEVDGFHIPDDETFDQADFLRRVAASEEFRSHPVHPRNVIWNYTNVMLTESMQLLCQGN